MHINRRDFLAAVGTGTAALSLEAAGAPSHPFEAAVGRPAPTQSSKKVVILLVHPNYGISVANKALVEAVKPIPGVQVIDMYAAPFVADTYKAAIAEASSIVFQFPFHWLSAPSLLKKWCDELLGAVTDSVKGKPLLVATTTGSEYGAYRSGGRNLFTIDELLRPYQVLAHHSGMIWQTPFVVYGATLPTAAQSIQAGTTAYQAAIKALL